MSDAETFATPLKNSVMDFQQLKNIVECALLAAAEPLNIDRILGLFEESERPEKDTLREVLSQLQRDCEDRGVELKEIGSGYRYQTRKDVAVWVSRLWEERPQRYSRALLETLALVAYRQPITRAEIEDIRGVAVSSNIMKTLQERGWVRIVGHRDVPGKPAMYATTKQFLDYFNLASLDQLPTLAELKDFDKLNAELDLRLPGEEGARPDSAESGPDARERSADGSSVAITVACDLEPVSYD